MSKSCSSVYIANFVKGCLSRSNVQWFSSICVWCQAAQSCNYAVSLRCLPLRLIIDKGYYEVVTDGTSGGIYDGYSGTNDFERLLYAQTNLQPTQSNFRGHSMEIRNRNASYVDIDYVIITTGDGNDECVDV